MGYQVITIDDSKIIRSVVNKAFEPYDCTVHEAENGVEGLAAIYKIRPDLVVLDLTMPVMDGIEMLEKLRSDDTVLDTPVIMLTAEASKNVVVKILSLGVKDYISKPFKSDQFMERVKKYLTLEEKKTSKFFKKESDIDVLDFPDTINSEVINEIKRCLTNNIKDGAKKIVTDLTNAGSLSLTKVQLLGFVLHHCKKADIPPLVIANDGMAKELSGYQETANAVVKSTINDVKELF